MHPSRRLEIELDPHEAVWQNLRLADEDNLVVDRTGVTAAIGGQRHPARSDEREMGIMTWVPAMESPETMTGTRLIAATAAAAAHKRRRTAAAATAATAAAAVHATQDGESAAAENPAQQQRLGGADTALALALVLVPIPVPAAGVKARMERVVRDVNSAPPPPCVALAK